MVMEIKKKLEKQVDLKKYVYNGVADSEPHNFGGAGAVTRCDSGSKSDVQHRRLIKWHKL
jgi:hypothetical protein